MAIGTTLKIGFDSAKVKTGLAGIKNDLKSFAKIGAGIAGVGVAIAAIGTASAMAALEINSIGEQARATDARLVNITKQMGLFGDKSADVTNRLIALADSEERLTGTDTIVDTQAKLMTFKELAASADQAGGAFDRATMAAVDMAAAGFGEATTNAVQLGKALNDPIKGINSLTRSGITFTDAEKARIKVLVESNRMGAAQSMILKAIETQVGGTARATATASSKMRQSFNQIVEAFAIPFSEGFDSLPGALESVFPKVVEIAGQLGRDIGTAISDAVQGDTTRLVAIGQFIGSIIGEASFLAVQTFFTNFGSDLVAGAKMSFKSEDEKNQIVRQNIKDKDFLFESRMADALSRLSLEYFARVANTSPTGTPQPATSPAPLPVSDPAFDAITKAIERLENIEKNTRTGSKM